MTDNIYRIGLINRSLIFSENISKISTVNFNLNKSELKQFESTRDKILNEMRDRAHNEIWDPILGVNQFKRIIDSTE